MTDDDSHAHSCGHRSERPPGEILPRNFNLTSISRQPPLMSLSFRVEAALTFAQGRRLKPTSAFLPSHTSRQFLCWSSEERRGRGNTARPVEGRGGHKADGYKGNCVVAIKKKTPIAIEA